MSEHKRYTRSYKHPIFTQNSNLTVNIYAHKRILCIQFLLKSSSPSNIAFSNIKVMSHFPPHYWSTSYRNNHSQYWGNWRYNLTTALTKFRTHMFLTSNLILTESSHKTIQPRIQIVTNSKTTTFSDTDTDTNKNEYFK